MVFHISKEYFLAHDLRTQLIVIGGFARRFLKVYGATLDTEAIDAINTIQKSAQKMERLIKDLLTFSHSNNLKQGKRARRSVNH